MRDVRRIFLNRLTITGPAKRVADFGFVDGLNVVWGASNSGKSMMVKCLDFAMGAGTPLPDVEEAVGYDRVWLELHLPTYGAVTLSRSVAGGNFELFEGWGRVGVTKVADLVLSADHQARSASVSGLLLQELNVGPSLIANNASGKKAAFTFRHFAPYVFTEETNMMAEWSPIRIHERSGDVFDKNVLKFILTGVDDSSIVETVSTSDQHTRNRGKIELIDDMLAIHEAEYMRRHPDLPALDDRESKLSAAIEDLQETLGGCQERLDDLRERRRTAQESLTDAEDRRTELALMLGRFEMLLKVYDSDIGRLEGLEEGASALLAGSRRDCPLCGADSDHQKHAHGSGDLQRTRTAARAEMAKIARERTDLVKAITSVDAERVGLERKAARLRETIRMLELTMEEEKPQEIDGRRRFTELSSAMGQVQEGILIRKQIDELQARKAELLKFKAKRAPKGSVVTGISGTVGHELAKTVETVLHAWRFPGLPTVSFDGERHDILLNGKSRRGNGKGVRALMNASFKIGVMLYCREKGLPHPGFLVLDSPLLSYRDPITSRHGELSSDEVEVKRSGLKEHFYDFVQKDSRVAQYIVVENDAPPARLNDTARVMAFVGEYGSGGRRGLFPV